VYADRFIPDDEKKRAEDTGEEAQAIPFLKRFTVFNLAQCESLPENLVVPAPPPEQGLIEPKVEALIKASGIDFRIGGGRAFYVPAQDYVQVPPPQAYFEPVNWHRTALHELGHASCAPYRLKRDLSGSFGSKKYALEELVAETNAAFCCASLGPRRQCDAVNDAIDRQPLACVTMKIHCHRLQRRPILLDAPLERRTVRDATSTPCGGMRLSRGRNDADASVRGSFHTRRGRAFAAYRSRHP
jgi:hypothetical protein